MSATSVSHLLNLAGQQWAWQAGAIIVGTFILEDAATVLAAMQAEAGAISVRVALISLYVGIILGDMGLYGLGRLAALVPRVRALLPPGRLEKGRRWANANVFRVVFISRFLPGARLPTYTACGFVGAGFLRFGLAAVLATLVWTSLLFTISMRIGAVLMNNLGPWRWVGAVGFAVVVVVIGRLAARLGSDHS